VVADLYRVLAHSVIQPRAAPLHQRCSVGVVSTQAPGLLDFNNRRTIFTRRVQADMAGRMRVDDHRSSMLLRPDHTWHDFYMFWHACADPTTLLQQVGTVVPNLTLASFLRG